MGRKQKACAQAQEALKSSCMKRTIALKLTPTRTQADALVAVQTAFADACNKVVPYAVEHRCWNRVALHHLAYYPVKAQTSVGSQMVCNAIAAVCEAYKALRLKKDAAVPAITFRPMGSVHFDKRTYALRADTVSLKTLDGRVLVPYVAGQRQRALLRTGVPKEAELVLRKGIWYFHLVLDLPDVPRSSSRTPLGVDCGENVLAATSNGSLHGGGQLRNTRDRSLALRRRLQSNGSQSARQHLKRLSGKERRRVHHTNHVVSKAVVQEAIDTGAGVLVLENLRHIRMRIKAGKRMRTRLHRWPWAQLHAFITYQAEAVGLRVVFVNPAYTSQTCSTCGCLGTRRKHRFVCSSCGNVQHSDVNASRNLCTLAPVFTDATGDVRRPHVAPCLVG
jgi:putative transposase